LNLSQSTDSDTLDLHKPYIDNITLVSSSGMPMYREPDLIDVWFDSGAMPFAQLHYPHSPNASEAFKANFPADFIAEGVDQTRGWFYTLHALGVMLFDSVAYRAVISNGLVLDRNGNKMSKRLGNAVDPFETLDTYSADATRWYMMTNAAPWDSLKFDAEGIQEVQRKFFGTLYNTYQFFALYANVDGFCFQEAYIPVAERPEMDKWILSSLHSLVQYVTEKYDDFEPTQAGRAVEYFLDNQLSNWYVRLCRRRFWKGEYEQDKICAYQTLYECLKTISQLIAPISPFFADWLYGNLNSVSGMYDVPSVHLSRFPVADAGCIDNKLENRMKMAQDITTLVLSIRKKVNIKVRQPLQKILIPVLDIEQKADIQSMESIILSELNIKEIEYISGDSSFIRKKIKANFKTLGARLGGLMKQTATAIASFTPEQIMSLERQGNYAIQVNGEEVNIGLQDVEILPDDIPGWSVANNDALTVALDVTISPELYNEGIARELVNRIQKIRKESNLALTDKISVNIQENALIAEAIAQYYDYLCTEILATHIFTVKEVTNGVEVDVYDTMLLISISKNSS
ncbi:MAG: isoleucine--tRNA ligase, partial [Chitinophagia bacterium]|nr:isoleucine--tRNA ligase [Chitinophagia bacterium]